MTPPIHIHASVDTSRLAAALKWRVEAIKSSRTMKQIVCSSALAVASRAMKRTPAVPISTIDRELNVFVGFGIGKRGQLLTSRRKRVLHSGRQNTGSSAWLHTKAPLAALIINAQVNYQSVFNQRTNHRYYRIASPFKGKSRMAGRAAMTMAVTRFIRARHSSTHFLQAGWIQPIKNLIPHASRTITSVGDLPSKPGSSQLGRSAIFDQGARVSVTIENSVGTEGVNPRYNEALWRYGLPALQWAVNDETERTVRFIMDWIDKDNAKCTAMMR